MPEWSELARLTGELGFPAVMAVIVLRAYLVMHQQNLARADAHTAAIASLTLELRTLRQWLELCRWARGYNAPDPPYPQKSYE